MDFSHKKTSNYSLQVDEIKALSAIFEDEFQLEKSNAFQIKVLSRFGKEVLLQVTFPKNYPLDSPPHYQISAPWMNRKVKKKLSAEMGDIYSNNRGESIVYQWVEAIKELMDEAESKETSDLSDDISPSSKGDVVQMLPNIHHGETISLKKSVFQAHLAQIISESQVKPILDKLKGNSKIASAKHNVYAYRIALGNGCFSQECDNDDEARAGPVLLNLLEILDLSNILIVVTRWYGGVHLGADRFKLYNNAARNLISELNLMKKGVTAIETKKTKNFKK